MTRLAILLLLAGCSNAVPMSVSPPIPYALTTCPDRRPAPPPMPRWRPIETVLRHDAAEDASRRAERARGDECAETLRRLVEWVEVR